MCSKNTLLCCNLEHKDLFLRGVNKTLKLKTKIQEFVPFNELLQGKG